MQNNKKKDKKSKVPKKTISELPKAEKGEISHTEWLRLNKEVFDEDNTIEDSDNDRLEDEDGNPTEIDFNH